MYNWQSLILSFLFILAPVFGKSADIADAKKHLVCLSDDGKAELTVLKQSKEGRPTKRFIKFFDLEGKEVVEKVKKYTEEKESEDSSYIITYNSKNYVLELDLTNAVVIALGDQSVENKAIIEYEVVTPINVLLTDKNNRKIYSNEKCRIILKD
ncbi:MAG: hypothetical protein H6620_05355 [Halobacteriovoraceae bacterium]|nr:hypothetical protein [Halobacteriovoraceae bacterium]